MNKNRRALLVGVVAGALCGALVPLVVGTGIAGADDSQAAKRTFQTRYETALMDVANAKARQAKSKKALRKARQRDRLKGQARIDIYAEVESAKTELDAAQKHLASFPEDAR